MSDTLPCVPFPAKSGIAEGAVITHAGPGQCLHCNALATVYIVDGVQFVLHEGKACRGSVRQFEPSAKNPSPTLLMDDRGEFVHPPQHARGRNRQLSAENDRKEETPGKPDKSNK